MGGGPSGREGVMVIAGVSDLMIASKIGTAAGGAGTEVRFGAATGAVVAALRAARPALLLLDLDDRRVDALAVLAAVASEPGIRPPRIVGFVSHVRADLIAAARDAGIDEVLARSAFFKGLGPLLAAAGPGAGGAGDPA